MICQLWILIILCFLLQCLGVQKMKLTLDYNLTDKTKQNKTKFKITKQNQTQFKITIKIKKMEESKKWSQFKVD